jgi:DNA-binding response OmpR family regulator
MTRGRAVGKESALIILRDVLGGREWVIDDEIVIGRDASCQVCLPDRQVSRRHAIVRRMPDGYLLADQGSKNGTWLNGVPVRAPVRLADGDEVSIAARFKLIFVDAEATSPLVFEGRGLRIDPDTFSVYLNGEPLDPPLSASQWTLLRALYDAAGALVTRDDLVAQLWPDEGGGGVSEDALDALVRRVRGRLSEIDPDHQYIVTSRGYGYRLVNP